MIEYTTTSKQTCCETRGNNQPSSINFVGKALDWIRKVELIEELETKKKKERFIYYLFNCYLKENSVMHDAYLLFLFLFCLMVFYFRWINYNSQSKLLEREKYREREKKKDRG